MQDRDATRPLVQEACDVGMMRHSANAAAAWTAPGEVWEYVSQLVSSYHDQHDCQVHILTDNIYYYLFSSVKTRLFLFHSSFKDPLNIRIFLVINFSIKLFLVLCNLNS